MGSLLLNDDGITNPSGNAHLTAIVNRAIAANPRRRALLKAGFGAATIPFFAGLTGCGDSDAVAAALPENMLGFTAVGVSSGDGVVVPAGYLATTILPWGEPLTAGAPAFKPDASNSAADQEKQVGDNHDGMWFFAFNASGTGYGNRNDEGILVFNHEYINPEYFYAPDTDAADWLAPFTNEKAKKAQAAHGASVAHVKRLADGSWALVAGSRYNRRIHGNTPMTMQGPAAGNDLVKTAADATGTTVAGMLNNCGSGWTPWGTFITCEENFNGYFGWNGTRTANALESRYGVTQSGFGYRWHTSDPRFDVNANPNEVNRFGYVVEIDPFEPDSRPIKRSSLGRFKHENAELVVAPNGKVVVYVGCDERNEYLYKFVSDGVFDAANPTSAANRRLLESGTLYVAKFNAGTTAGDNMGEGAWIALVYGQNGLSETNGFKNQGDVLIRARQAADLVGATMMDRPEWVASNPKKVGEIYVTMTNNNRRGGTTANNANGTTAAGSARPPTDEANPRTNNVWGHIVRWNEAGANPAALSFSWDIFVLAGQPSLTDARKPSANITLDNVFNSPDGLSFDSAGRMWIQTDGNFSNAGEFAGMGNNQMLVADTATKEIRRFLVGPAGCEVTGITWTPDRTTMFVNIQHPGEVGSHPNAPKSSAGTVLTDNDLARNATAFSQWPTRGVRPRSATVVVRKIDGGVIAA